VKKLYGEWGDDPFSEWLGSESTPKDIETLRELGYVR
jgi:hypothetical protein